MKAEPGAVQRGPSIWTRPERASRGPAPEHSRAEIASAGVSLADARGLVAVTMRSVAAAIGTSPASLYRYVLTRDELVELMADHVYGEFTYARAASGETVENLLGLARQGRAVYQRHPWLLDVTATAGLPGPNAVAFIEHTLAALAGTNLGGAARLEFVGLFSGTVRLIAQTEIGQQRAGQQAAEWQVDHGHLPAGDRGRWPAPEPGRRPCRPVRGQRTNTRRAVLRPGHDTDPGGLLAEPAR